MPISARTRILEGPGVSAFVIEGTSVGLNPLFLECEKKDGGIRIVNGGSVSRIDAKRFRASFGES